MAKDDNTINEAADPVTETDHLEDTQETIETKKEPTSSKKKSSSGAQNEGDMTINLKMPDITELKPKITVFGVGGAGGNAVNNMIKSGLEGVEFVVANTDAQALSSSHADRMVQMGLQVTQGLGAGSQPDVGRQSAEEVIDELNDYLTGSHMAFITAGMGGGTGTGAAPVVARAAREMGILTVGVVTKPFQFEGARRMRLAEEGIEQLQAHVDTLIVIPNQNLFRVANEKTTFSDAFSMADQVLYSGVACITDLMVKEGLINLDFADVRSVMKDMGNAMMGTGEASGENRAIEAAEAAIANPLLDETSMQGAQGLLISITGGNDLTLYEVDEAATRIREEVDQNANIILGATFDESLEGIVRVSVVATGIESGAAAGSVPEVKAAASFMRPRAEEAIEARADSDAAEGAEPSAAMNRPAMDMDTAPAAEAEVEMPSEPEEMVQAEAAKTDADVTISPFTPSEDALQLAQSAVDAADSDDLDTVMDVKPYDESSEAPSGPFIPPVAETPVGSKRMPSVDDFPMIVREEIKAKAQSSLEINEGEDRGALGLLKRITNATLGGGKEEDGGAEAVEPSVAVPPTASMPVAQEAATPDPVVPQDQPAETAMAEGAEQAAASSPRIQPRQAQATNYAPQAGNLDPQGRVTPKATLSTPEDQLEIPAFLRRQAQ